MTAQPIDPAKELIQKAHAFRDSLGDADIKPETILGLWMATADALEPLAKFAADVLQYANSDGGVPVAGEWHVAVSEVNQLAIKYGIEVGL